MPERISDTGAIAGVGRLDGVTRILPASPLFLYMYVRKEALLSSQIEGTQSSPLDLLRFENREAPTSAQNIVNIVIIDVKGPRREARKPSAPLSL